MQSSYADYKLSDVELNSQVLKFIPAKSIMHAFMYLDAVTSFKSMPSRNCGRSTVAVAGQTAMQDSDKIDAPVLAMLHQALCSDPSTYSSAGSKCSRAVLSQVASC